MNRTLDEIVSEINANISDNLSYSANQFFKIATQNEKNGKQVIITRTTAQEQGTLISPNELTKMTFYHRVIDEAPTTDTVGKGNSMYQFLNTTVRLVGMGVRNKFRAKLYWDNDEVMNEVIRIMNQKPRLSMKETITIDAFNSDIQTVIDEEIAPQSSKELKLELAAFYIEYTIKRRINC